MSRKERNLHHPLVFLEEYPVICDHVADIHIHTYIRLCVCMYIYVYIYTHICMHATS